MLSDRMAQIMTMKRVISWGCDAQKHVSSMCFASGASDNDVRTHKAVEPGTPAGAPSSPV